MTGRVFHLVTSADPTARLATSTVAHDQLERHGFVHCCFREQLVEIASWWFDDADDLVALELDPSCLSADLRFEPSPDRWYPHLYGPIDTAAVVAAHDLPRGSSRPLPPALREPPPGYQLTGRPTGDGQATMTTVRWRADGHVDGDRTWIDRARKAIAEGLTVELPFGGHVPATLDTAYESFIALASVADVTRYDGDGFF